MNILPAAALLTAAALLAGSSPASAAQDGNPVPTRLEAQPQAERQADPGAGRQAAASGNPLWRVSLEALSATRERPIFSPSRRPPAVAAPVAAFEEPPPAPPPEPERLALSLVGTVTGDQNRLAVFVSPANDVVRLRVGEASDGWVLRSVDARTTTLVKDSREVILAFPTPDAAAPSAEAFPPREFTLGQMHKPGRPPPPAAGDP